MTSVVNDPNAAFVSNNTASNQCGVTLMNNADGQIIARVMSKKPDVKTRELPAMIRVDGIRQIDFDMAELSDAIGRDFSPADFEEVMSTHYGRMVVTDEHVYFFANPEDAAEYISFDLKPVVKK